MKRKKIFRVATLVLLFSVLMTTIPAQTTSANSKNKSASQSTKVNWPKGPSVGADSAIVMDAKTGLILYSKNIHKKQYPASITKIMTTLLALENCSLSETVSFSKTAVNIESGSTHIGIKAGEQLSMQDSLYAIMLNSANEVSNGVAEHISGSISEFAKLMTKRAKELGCEDTHFANANGLHDDNHYTSAYDMALISKAALQNSTFRSITQTRRYTIGSTNLEKTKRYMSNHHQMLNPVKYPQYAYEYCIGGKTGFTNKARNTLVTFAKKGDMELICVVLKSSPPNVLPNNQYTDTIKLLNFGFENYTTYNINSQSNGLSLDSSQLFTRYNPLFDKNSSSLQVSGDGYVILPNKVKLSEATKTVTVVKNTELKDGSNVIGSIVYNYGGKQVGHTDIIYNKSASVSLDTSHKINKNDTSDNPLVNLFNNATTSHKVSPLLILAIVLIIIVILVIALIILFQVKKQSFSHRSYRRRNIFRKRF
ncbi:D-alanyl-D-alanine carboxypeptidase [Lachnospiraceae bacterium KM106-2]|nr:D-alanyl-D-alanine carboxypeptidase [Lachnospiraceae bacterium KM106-2]